MHAFERIVIGSHAVILKIRYRIHSVFGMLGEHCGKFLCAVIAVIEENHHMSCAYAAVYTVVDYRLDKFVGNALCV